MVPILLPTPVRKGRRRNQRSGRHTAPVQRPTVGFPRVAPVDLRNLAEGRGSPLRVVWWGAWRIVGRNRRNCTPVIWDDFTLNFRLFSPLPTGPANPDFSVFLRSFVPFLAVYARRARAAAAMHSPSVRLTYACAGGPALCVAALFFCFCPVSRLSGRANLGVE